jgi:hypothetical protein
VFQSGAGVDHFRGPFSEDEALFRNFVPDKDRHGLKAGLKLMDFAHFEFEAIAMYFVDGPFSTRGSEVSLGSSEHFNVDFIAMHCSADFLH